ncbi:MAG: hypothetical protein ABL898_00160 [Hyphomicrobiaceae bacterium]
MAAHPQGRLIRSCLARGIALSGAFLLFVFGRRQAIVEWESV